MREELRTMDEIKMYRALMQAACSSPSGIGDIRSAVWKDIDKAGLFHASDERDGYGSVNILSTRISSMAAAVMLSCVIAGYIIVDNYMKGAAMLSQYYDILDGMYSMIWGVF